MKDEKIKQIVRKRYGDIAQQSSSCCGSTNSCSCGSQPIDKGSKTPDGIGKNIGYSETELRSVPDGSNLGLGCGNPTAISSLKEGDTVLDLGSGAGFDAFLASNKVGTTGHVIGVDMTHEMLQKARSNAEKGNYKNVEFRLGEIEHLPIGDNTVDVIISNCVINLAPNKTQVFQEAFRVLKPGGRICVSDIVLLKPLPEYAKTIDAYTGCVAGALLKEEYLNTIQSQGFEKIIIHTETQFSSDIVQVAPDSNSVTKKDLDEVCKTIESITLEATKPK